jgi:outer membrane receptor protein involved in Fe transport
MVALVAHRVRAILGIAAGCLLASSAWCTNEARAISIPPGDLASALNAFARQYDVDVLYRYDQLKDARTDGVSGTMPADAAVKQLLQGTPFTIRRDPSGALLVALAADSKKIAQPARLAQAATPAPTRTDVSARAAERPEEIVVVGSHIAGSAIDAVLPTTVIGIPQIIASGATSGDELFRSVPQAGAVAFNESRTIGGINDARGDVASINLRALGTGNTLVLLNGRRLVLHPGTQAENLVPVQSVNTNSIPVMGVQRLEMLRDGAAAIYGTDAVAGVINTVLRTDFEGVAGEVQYGGSEGTSLREMTATGQFGMSFNEGRSNFSLFTGYYDRTGMPASQRSYSKSADLRPQVAGTAFADNANFDNRSTGTPWGAFQTLGVSRVTQNGAMLTSAAGAFHIQPTYNEGCRAALGAGICIDDGAMSATADRNLRYDINGPRSLVSDGRRANAFAFFNHDFGNGLEFFSELGYYDARTQSDREPTAPLTGARIAVPASSYYNPFGATTLPDGSPNPNRLPGLNVPAGGIALAITGYRPADTPPRHIVVDDDSYRVLTGLRYDLGDWNMETAALYSEAQTVDRTSNNISNTLFQQALSRSTPDAYNPFNGGDVDNPSLRDTTPSNAAAMNSFLIDAYRDSETTLSLADFKVSNSRLLQLPAGGLGIAVGTEWRRESFRDDRDPRLDGTITFTNPVTGDFSGSDVMGSSPTPDTSGHRHVVSGFVEFAVPLVRAEMQVPFMQSLQFQVAGRYEDYSDVGDVFKPKIAFAWQMFDWVGVRASWSEGFRAPNLPQVFERGVERVNARTDYVRCEAELRAGRVPTFEACALTQQVSSTRSGSRDLEPEDDENYSAGLVFTPSFAPSLTLSADYWRVKQEGVIGIFGDGNHLALDYLLRVRGSNNPQVVRRAPDQDDIDAFAGTGLAPVGDVITVVDNYVNLLPRKADGIDFGVQYQLARTALGNWDFNLNAARLLTFTQDPSADALAIINAQAGGEIADSFVVEVAQSLVERDARPKWRGTLSVNWNMNNWGAGVFGNYVGRTLDANASLADGTPFEIEDWITANVYGQYRFSTGWLEGTTVRLGVRNVTDEDPPLADESYGYLGESHSNRGRYWHASLRRQF